MSGVFMVRRVLRKYKCALLAASGLCMAYMHLYNGICCVHWAVCGVYMWIVCSCVWGGGL